MFASLCKILEQNDKLIKYADGTGTFNVAYTTGVGHYANWLALRIIVIIIITLPSCWKR